MAENLETLGVGDEVFASSNLVELKLPTGFTIGDVCFTAYRLRRSRNNIARAAASVIYESSKDAIKGGLGVVVANATTSTIKVPSEVSEIFVKAFANQRSRSVDFADGGPNWLYDRYYG